jgi:hypothetical protein
MASLLKTSSYRTSSPHTPTRQEYFTGPQVIAGGGGALKKQQVSLNSINEDIGFILKKKEEIVSPASGSYNIKLKKNIQQFQPK